MYAEMQVERWRCRICLQGGGLLFMWCAALRFGSVTGRHAAVVLM
jgi:hypothetical protein